jgi:uncharacterized protein YaaN involved in tellurite resistance
MKNFDSMFGGQKTATPTPGVEVLTMPTVQVNQTALVTATKPQLPTVIEDIGKSSTDKVNQLAEQVLNKVKGSDLGSLGKGVTDILALTESVDLKTIPAEDGDGLIGKLVSKFKYTRTQMISKFEDVNTQVEKIADNLRSELVKIRDENKWLDDLYQANLQEVHALQANVEQLKTILSQQVAYVESLKAQSDQSMDHAQLVQDEVNVQTRIERQIDRLERFVQIGMMDAPDIRSMQKNNVDTESTFRDIIEVTLPLWRRQLAEALQAAKQQRRAELGNAIADRNNELMRRRADILHDASIKTAQLSQRSSVADTETLEYTQTKLIDRLKQVKAIEQQGRTQRQADAQKMLASREALRNEMRSWGQQ